MPRVGRLHIVGGCYHVMGRGLERRRIFDGAADKADFLNRLGDSLAASQAQCLAWAVMPNHYHLLIRAGRLPLSRLMAPLLGGYASHYNRRHRRHGYVFQNRYKSILCDADSYLLELVRYIHLNPLRAGLVDSLSALDRYPWTGHAVLLGRRRQDWQEVDAVLARFAKRGSTARARYRQFIKDGLAAQHPIDVTGGGLVRSYGGWDSLKRLRQDHVQRIGDERILGDSDFVARMLREDNASLDKRALRERQGWDWERLVRRVCAFCDVDPHQLLRKGRANRLSLAKSLIGYWASSELGLANREIADRLHISQPAVSKSASKGRHHCQQHGLDLDAI